MRNVPATLQAHLDQVATTTTRLLKVTLRTGLSYGLAMLDRDVVYDDGSGEITYVATNGFDPSTLASDIGFTVDNAESYALISNDVSGVTEEMIARGDLDDAQWIMYLVNFEDLGTGRHVILDAGDLGEVRVRYGMVWIPEILSYAMRLKQPIGTVWSRKCRAIFGTPAASHTGCGVNTSALWVTGEVTAVGAESNRQFTGTALETSPSMRPFPGRLQWLTGPNAGREFATEAIAGLVCTLNETTAYAIQVGDDYRIRPDCLKRYQEDCITRWANGPNFKGEPLIPVGDASQGQVPGAQIPRGGARAGDINRTQEE